VRTYLLDPERLQPVDRDSEPDRLRDLRRAGLKLPRQLGPGRLVGGNRADHVTATDERRHLLEQRPAAVEHADTGGTVGLVAGPGVEVGIDRAQVDRDLRDRLGAIDHDDGSRLVRPSHDLLDGVDRAQHV